MDSGIWQDNTIKTGVSTRILMAEPGMGKTAMLLKSLRAADTAGYPCEHLDLSGGEPGAAAQKITRYARNVIKAHEGDGKTTLLCVDHVPAMDEADARRVSRAVKRLEEAGITVMMALRPEAELVAEAIEGAHVITSEAFRVSEVAGYDTGGIPLLAEAARSENAHGDAPELLPGYEDAYESLVRLSLRPEIMHEERELRIAMMLLGAGGLDELEHIIPRMDDDILACLQRDAPFFGVDMRNRRFRCVGMVDPERLLRQASVIEQEIADVRIAERAAKLLAERGEFRRMVVICGMGAGEEVRARLGIEWAMELIDAGQTAFVQASVGLAQATFAAKPSQRGAAAVALDAICSKSFAFDKALDSRMFGDALERRAWRRAGLMARVRAALAGQVIAPEQRDDDDSAEDPMCLRLETHLAVCARIREGRLAAAQRMLLTCNADAPQEMTFSAALLRLDYELVRVLLLGEQELGQRASFDAACGFIARMGGAEIFGYAGAIAGLSDILAGGRAKMLSELAMQAERYGATALQAELLCAMSASDMQAQNWPRAHVRALKAHRLASEVGEKVLAHAAYLLDCVVRMETGEQLSASELRAYARPRNALTPAAELAARALESDPANGWDEHGAIPETAPKDALWLVTLLARGTHNAAQRIRAVIPRAWRAPIDLAESQALLSSQEDSLIGADGLVYREGEGMRAHIELRLLGTVEMRVDGVLIDDRTLERRNAKSVLACIASAQGRSIPRLDIIESVWPDVDYDTGNRRLYQALWVLRCAIQRIDAKLNPFLSSRMQRTVGIDMHLLHSDLDDFELSARYALDSEGDDEAVCAHARAVENLYKGDLCIAGIDAGGTLDWRRRELRMLYVDTMVTGAEAALRLGKLRVAVRLAQKAQNAEPLREDAMDVLLRAMRASGRTQEAKTSYKDYSLKLADEAGMAPSKGLRTLALDRDLRIHRMPRQEIAVYEAS